MAVLKFADRHNSVVTIDLAGQENAAYHPILRFLLRSRIHHVLTHNPTVIGDYVRDFWRTATYNSEVDPPVIRATVSGRDLQFSQADLREILHLGDAEIDDGPVELPATLRKGALGRMGYTGDVTKSIVKSGLFGQWRYFAHVIIQCLSARKSGFDHVNTYEQSIMVALTYNKAFSLSRYFFDIFRNMIDGAIRDKFLLFPRFVMMIILHYFIDIPMITGTLQVGSIAARIFKDCIVVKANSTQRQETALFGHLIDEAYVAPPNDGWTDVGDAAQPPVPQQQPLPQPQQPPSPSLAVSAEILNDILNQVEQHAANVDQGLIEDLTDAILNPHNQEDVFRQIDEFPVNPEDDIDRQIDNFSLRDDDDGGNDDQDGESSSDDEDDQGPKRLGLYGSKVVNLQKTSDVGSLSRKRKTTDEDDADFDPCADLLVKSRKKSKGPSSAPPGTTLAESLVPVTTQFFLPPQQPSTHSKSNMSAAIRINMLETTVERLSSKLASFDHALKAQQAEHERQIKAQQEAHDKNIKELRQKYYEQIGCIVTQFQTLEKQFESFESRGELTLGCKDDVLKSLRDYESDDDPNYRSFNSLN